MKKSTMIAVLLFTTFAVFCGCQLGGAVQALASNKTTAGVCGSFGNPDAAE